MTIYLIIAELLENMLFLLQHFSYLFVGKLGENQRNEEELVKSAVFWLPGSESLVVTKGWNWKDNIETRAAKVLTSLVSSIAVPLFASCDMPP